MFFSCSADLSFVENNFHFYSWTIIARTLHLQFLLTSSMWRVVSGDEEMKNKADNNLLHTRSIHTLETSWHNLKILASSLACFYIFYVFSSRCRCRWVHCRRLFYYFFSRRSWQRIQKGKSEKSTRTYVSDIYFYAFNDAEQRCRLFNILFTT